MTDADLRELLTLAASWEGLADDPRVTREDADWRQAMRDNARQLRFFVACRAGERPEREG